MTDTETEPHCLLPSESALVFTPEKGLTLVLSSENTEHDMPDALILICACFFLAHHNEAFVRNTIALFEASVAEIVKGETPASVFAAS